MTASTQHRMTESQAAAELVDHLDTHRRLFNDTATQLLVEGVYVFASGHSTLRRILIGWRLARALSGRR